MKIAYKPYKDFPNSQELLMGIPENHPALCKEVDDNFEEIGWTIVSKEDFKILKSQTDPLVDAWRQTLIG